MYQQKARGHGVCGSLNIYSNNVKLGNWVEDTIAAELIANPTEPYKNFSTNTSLSYLDPKDQPPPPTMNMPSTQELKAKNKEGMPYGLIFDHGMTPVTSEDRLMTTNMVQIMKPTHQPEDLASEQRLTRARSKKVLDDYKQAYHRTSQNRLANANLPFKLDIAPRPILGKTEQLPRFTRIRTLTSTIPGMLTEH